jgi:hypothetical protein
VEKLAMHDPEPERPQATLFAPTKMVVIVLSSAVGCLFAYGIGTVCTGWLSTALRVGSLMVLMFTVITGCNLAYRRGRADAAGPDEVHEGKG